MTNKAEDEIEETVKIGPGDLLAFGSINLLLTLDLNNNDLTKYKLKWEDLETLKNLKFIRKHKHFWKRVELSSNNDTLNILLNINKTSKKLIKIGYVVLKKMIYKEKQIDFQDFINEVTQQKGIYLTSCDVCKCTICVQLLLKYENQEKIFLLSGQPPDINNTENKNNENNEIKKDNKDLEENQNKKEYVEDKNNENKENNEKEENKDKNENNENNDNKDKKDFEEDKKNENNGNNEKTEENKEDIISKIDGENEVNNPFVNIVDNNINVGDFNYVYFNFNDYTNGEFKGKIKLEHLFEYFQDIKIRTTSKIILNFAEEAEIFKNKNKDEIFKDLLSITDLFIFYNKNKLYDVLKDLKEEEDKEVIDLSYKIHCFESQRKLLEKEKMKKKEEEWAKNYKIFLEKNRTGKENKIPKHLRTMENNIINSSPNIYVTQDTQRSDKDSETYKNNLVTKNNESNQDIESKNESISQNVYPLNTEAPNEYSYRDLMNHRSLSEGKKNALLPIKPSPPKPLNKNDMFNYFKNGIFNRDPQKKPKDKIILVLDEFNRIFIVKCNKFEEKPFVLDFDLKLYPKVNVRNMNDILDYKKFIRSKFPEYVNIFMGSLLSVITGKGKFGFEENSLFLGYLVATNTIKKIAEIQRFNLPLPKNKDFFYPTINKNEVDKLVLEANKKRKEKSFILDGNNRKNMILKPYNPLLDKNLYSYLNTKNNRNFLKNNGFIGKNGRIIYDPIYRDTLGFNKQQSLQNINLEKITKKNLLKPSSNVTNKFLVGYRIKSPGYEIYNQRKKKQIILPPINQKKHSEIVQHKNEKKIIEEKSEDEASNEGSGSGEPSDSGNGEGSGSGNGSPNDSENGDE